MMSPHSYLKSAPRRVWLPWYALALTAGLLTGSVPTKVEAANKCDNSRVFLIAPTVTVIGGPGTIADAMDEKSRWESAVVEFHEDGYLYVDVSAFLVEEAP